MRKEGVVPESPARVPAAPPRYAALCRTYTLFLIPGMHPSSLTLTPGNDVSHFEVAYYSSGSSRISPRFKISSFMQPLVSLRIQCFRQYIQEGRGDETKEKKRRILKASYKLPYMPTIEVILPNVCKKANVSAKLWRPLL